MPKKKHYIEKMKKFKLVVKGTLLLLLIYIVLVEGYELITLKKTYETYRLKYNQSKEFEEFCAVQRSIAFEMAGIVDDYEDMVNKYSETKSESFRFTICELKDRSNKHVEKLNRYRNEMDLRFQKFSELYHEKDTFKYQFDHEKINKNCNALIKCIEGYTFTCPEKGEKFRYIINLEFVGITSYNSIGYKADRLLDKYSDEAQRYFIEFMGKKERRSMIFKNLIIGAIAFLLFVTDTFFKE